MTGPSLKTIGRVAVGQEPHNVQVNPDGKLVWVTNDGEPAEEKKKRRMRRCPGRGMVWSSLLMDAVPT